MKANELMIGDWVKVISNDHLKYIQIAEIYQNSILTKESEFESEEISIDNIKPIPITPEILEKSGLEHNKGEMYYHGKLMYHHESKYVSICYGANNYWHLHINNGCDFSKAIKYVHELQHALRLCGIEKQIEL